MNEPPLPSATVSGSVTEVLASAALSSAVVASDGGEGLDSVDVEVTSSCAVV